MRWHHVSLRQAADKLEAAPPDADVAELVFDVARLMLHHTNFEGDYIYPELSHESWMALMKAST